MKARRHQPQAEAAPARARLRLDKWLWHARFFKTRSLAARYVEQARMRLDGRVVERCSTPVAAGDVLTFALGDGVRVVRVLALGERRGPPAEARTLYLDLGAGADAAAASNVAAVILAPRLPAG